MDALSKALEDTKRESSKFKEMAEISSLQAQTIGNFRSAHADEIKELHEHVSCLESRSDDDILTGRLQRQLMATKASYKNFVQKYQMLRGGMRQRELKIRLLEAKLDQRESSVAKLQDNHSKETAALKKALRNVQNMVEADSSLLSSKRQQKVQMARRINSLPKMWALCPLAGRCQSSVRKYACYPIWQIKV